MQDELETTKDLSKLCSKTIEDRTSGGHVFQAEVKYVRTSFSGKTVFGETEDGKTIEWPAQTLLEALKDDNAPRTRVVE